MEGGIATAPGAAKFMARLHPFTRNAVLDGKITRNTPIRLIRDGVVIYTGKLGSLKRFKDDVKEVVGGYECGLNIEKFNDIKIGDIVEGYEIVQTARTL